MEKLRSLALAGGILALSASCAATKAETARADEQPTGRVIEEVARHIREICDKEASIIMGGGDSNNLGPDSMLVQVSDDVGTVRCVTQAGIGKDLLPQVCLPALIQWQGGMMTSPPGRVSLMVDCVDSNEVRE